MALPFQDRQRPDEATNRYHSFRNDFDTVTVLGFSSYVHPNQIVDFFTSKEGHCWCVSINNYPPRVVLRFSSPIVAQRIVLRYDNANVFGQRLRVVPASIHREQENERNILQPVRISPALYGSYTPRIFPKHVQPNSMAMSVVNNGTSFLKLAKVFLVQKALQDGKIQNPRKIETPLLQNQGFQSPMLGNTPNRSTLLDTRHQNYNKNNPWKPSSCTGNLQKNTSKESLTSKSKADEKSSLAGNKKTANDCDEGIRSKDQTIINKEEDKKVKEEEKGVVNIIKKGSQISDGPFIRRKRRRKSRGRKKNSISSNTAADFKNSCSKADLPADKKIVKGNEVLMKETKQSVGVEVKCPTSGEKEIDARCRKTAQSSGKNCGIMAAVSDNNDNHTERKTLTHSDNSHTKTRDQCEENNVNVSDIKSSNCPVDGSRNKCDKDECKQSVIVNKESNTAKNCCLYNKDDGSGLGTTKKCSTDSSYKKFSGGNKSDKADQQSSGAGMYTSKGKGCGKNNESSKSMPKDKGFLKSSMTNISQETNTNGDGIRTSITKGKLEATHGFPKASGNKNSVPQRNMATEKHWVNTSRGKGSQKRNQSDVAGLKKISRVKVTAITNVSQNILRAVLRTTAILWERIQ
ncbi:uncharacterized protein LOC114521760 isoform X2 [Dendronephthya gigantea]|uniref:uncharacterized protein LOC114521760 isoform X2 n=1 Tax=Dendronephthya gigantea TaxID=151771 RepID=UPI00106A9EED|nr:uncharacterized protein LOC114521760 isoform X2 [Dendronephthya gigantea]